MVRAGFFLIFAPPSDGEGWLVGGQPGPPPCPAQPEKFLGDSKGNGWEMGSGWGPAGTLGGLKKKPGSELITEFELVHSFKKKQGMR